MDFQCNEAEPVCVNCERHQLPCVYDRNVSHAKRSQVPNKAVAVASTKTWGGSGARVASNTWGYLFNAASENGQGGPPESRSRRMLEIKLMHQYITETGHTLVIDNVSRDMFVVKMPESSFRSDALLFAMHAVATLHLEKLGRRDVAGFTLESVASKYFSMTLREHKREIAQMSKETVDTILHDILLNPHLRGYSTAGAVAAAVHAAVVKSNQDVSDFPRRGVEARRCRSELCSAPTR